MIPNQFYIKEKLWEFVHNRVEYTKCILLSILRTAPVKSKPFNILQERRISLLALDIDFISNLQLDKI
jgi:hypothetical protein